MSSSRDLILGDNVTEELCLQYRSPIVCSRTSPVIDGFVPTTFGDLSSVVSSIGRVIEITSSVDSLLMLPVTSFRSNWKYYGVQYTLDLMNEFTELLASPCFFVSKLQEFIEIQTVLVGIPKEDLSIFDTVRETFIFEYMDKNHPKLNVKRLKLT